jgi:hypothetical protein
VLGDYFKKLKASFTKAFVQDLESVHNIDLRSTVETSIMKQNVAAQILEDGMPNNGFNNWDSPHRRSNNIHRYQTSDGGSYYVPQSSSSMVDHLINNMSSDGIFRVPDPYARDMGNGSAMHFLEVVLWIDPTQEVFRFLKLPHRVVTMKEVNNCSDITQVQDLFLTRFYEPARPGEIAAAQREEKASKTYKDKLEDTRDIDL